MRLAVGQVIIPSLRTDWYASNPQCTPAMQSANCGITAICTVFPSTIPSCMATCSAQAYHCQSDSFGACPRNAYRSLLALC